MKSNVLLPFYLFTFLLFIGCSPSVDPEAEGAKMLSEARAHYAAAQYDAARDTILSLRRRFPTAIEARKAAMLLLDSVEYQAAAGDTLKQEFFRRKLLHDQQTIVDNPSPLGEDRRGL